MRVSSNDKFITKRRKWGTYASLGGLAVLIVGMIASFQPQYIWISLVAIILGFLLAQYGNYNLRRWGRAPRPDQVIETSLKGFDDRYHYYAWSLPAPYVLLTPNGVYSFVIRDQTGPITVDGARWRAKMSLGRVLTVFAQEGLGNPSDEAVTTAARLSDWIRKALPDMKINVQSAVVFIDPRAKLTLNAPTVPVVEVEDMKKWLRGAGKGDGLRSAEYKAIEELFDGNVAAWAKR